MRLWSHAGAHEHFTTNPAGAFAGCPADLCGGCSPGLPRERARAACSGRARGGHGLADKPLVRGSRHMVAAANAYAVEAGRDILRRGGSAIDAAIAVQLVLNLVEPQSSGIGGGAFIVHFDAATKTLITYDGRETAPASARPDRFLKGGRPMPFGEAVRSGLSVGVPGVIAALEMSHRQHGRLPWADLFGARDQAGDGRFHCIAATQLSAGGVRCRRLLAGGATSFL